MRKVEELEYRKWHCIMCGSTNKMITTYSYYGEPNVAHLMRCCNCGQETFYTDPNRVVIRERLQVGGRFCLKGRACYNYNCPLHPRFHEFNHKPPISCESKCFKNQVYPKLTINLDEPKYL